MNICCTPELLLFPRHLRKSARYNLTAQRKACYLPGGGGGEQAVSRCLAGGKSWPLQLTIVRWKETWKTGFDLERPCHSPQTPVIYLPRRMEALSHRVRRMCKG